MILDVFLRVQAFSLTSVLQRSTAITRAWAPIIG